MAPLWFIVDGDDLVFITNPTSIKGRHLHANPRAALVVDDPTFPYAFIAVRGPVALQDDERYVPDRAAEFGARNDAPGETLVRLRMECVVGQADLAL